jgi:4-amino-4-deoxy-L-arabinose transferase
LIPTLYDEPLLPYDWKSWVSTHIWLHKQPLPLWTIALSIYFFGVNEIAVRVPSIIFSTIGIGLMFRIGCYFFDKRIAYFSALLFSINGLIIELTGGRIATDHIDIFFLFFIMLAVFFTVVFIEKQKTIYNIAVGISLGAAIMCKWLPALIVWPMWLLLILGSKRFTIKQMVFQFLLMCFICFLIFLPWQFYIFHYFPMEAKWEASFNVKHITEMLEQQGGPFYYYLNQLRINYGELIYIPLIWFCWDIYKNGFCFKKAALLIWILIPLLFFSFAATKMQGYILFVSPALFAVTAAFWFKLFEHKNDKQYTIFYWFVLVAIAILPFRYLIERIKPFEKNNREQQWAIDLKKLKKKGFKNAVILNYERPVEAMFYMDCMAYNNLPSVSFINELIAKGKMVIVNDKENVSKEIRSTKNIYFEKLSE